MQKIVDGDIPTFIGGALVPPGTLVTVPEGIKPGDNLVDVGERPTLIPAEVAAIGPTGPKPENPQQVPPGAFQTTDGYASGQHLMVGAGSDLLNTPAAEQQAVEEEPVTRTGSNDDDDLVAGTVPEVTAQIEAEGSDLDAIEAAENDRQKPRQGVLSAIATEREKRNG